MSDFEFSALPEPDNDSEIIEQDPSQLKRTKHRNHDHPNDDRSHSPSLSDESKHGSEIELLTSTISPPSSSSVSLASNSESKQQPTSTDEETESLWPQSMPLPSPQQTARVTNTTGSEEKEYSVPQLESTSNHTHNSTNQVSPSTSSALSPPPRVVERSEDDEIDLTGDDDEMPLLPLAHQPQPQHQYQTQYPIPYQQFSSSYVPPFAVPFHSPFSSSYINGQGPPPSQQQQQQQPPQQQPQPAHPYHSSLAPFLQSTRQSQPLPPPSGSQSSQSSIDELIDLTNDNDDLPILSSSNPPTSALRNFSRAPSIISNSSQSRSQSQSMKDEIVIDDDTSDDPSLRWNFIGTLIGFVKFIGPIPLYLQPNQPVELVQSPSHTDPNRMIVKSDSEDILGDLNSEASSTLLTLIIGGRISITASINELLPQYNQASIKITVNGHEYDKDSLSTVMRMRNAQYWFDRAIPMKYLQHVVPSSAYILSNAFKYDGHPMAVAEAMPNYQISYYNPQATLPVPHLPTMGAVYRPGPAISDIESHLETVFSSEEELHDIDTTKLQIPAVLSTALKDYQQQGLAWMLEREKIRSMWPKKKKKDDKPEEEKKGKAKRKRDPFTGQLYSTDVDPDDDEVKAFLVWEKQRNVDGSVQYVHQTTKVASTHPPMAARGGILADDMGLGKTLQMLALIASSLPEPDVSSVDEIVEDIDDFETDSGSERKGESKHDDEDDIVDMDDEKEEKAVRRRSLFIDNATEDDSFDDGESIIIDDDSDPDWNPNSHGNGDNGARFEDEDGDEYDIRPRPSRSFANRSSGRERKSNSRANGEPKSFQPPSFNRHRGGHANRPDHPGPTLVVCPLSVIHNWQQQIQTHIRSDAQWRVTVYHGPHRHSVAKYLAHSDVVITTYNIVAQEYPDEEGKAKKREKAMKAAQRGGLEEPLFCEDVEESVNNSPLFNIQWFRVVLDEAHVIRERKTLQSRACVALRSTMRWCVSGTPYQNKIDDGFALLTFLRVEPFTDHLWWTKLILTPMKQRDQRGLERLQQIMSSICLRRKKNDEQQGKKILVLPDKTSRYIYITLTDEEKHLYQILASTGVSEFKRLLRSGDVMRNYSYILEMLLRMRQACDHASLVPVSYHKNGFGLSSSSMDETRRMLTLLEESCADECDRCHRSLDSNDAVVLPCVHFYHKNCLEELINQGGVCAIDRLPISRERAVTLDFKTILKAEESRAAYHELASQRAQSKSDAPRSSAKMVALLAELRSCVEARDKAVVFSQWTSFLDLLEPMLENEDMRYVRLDGSMNSTARIAALQSFDRDSNIRVFLISLKAGGVGLNLTAANRVYLMDIWWNPAAEDQAVDRIHRLGQTKAVDIVRMIVNETVEERVLSLQIEKREMTSNAMMKVGGRKGKQQEQAERLRDLQTLFGVQAPGDSGH